ncbi:hypothetical protein Rcae01_04368 [Novipirellula caenicola]|uniref:Uncharacterized protein n=1 Tax=Novipirellula caenicola TaxID=1536901 RepID=A0ABP9VUS8_9BACT
MPETRTNLAQTPSRILATKRLVRNRDREERPPADVIMRSLQKHEISISVHSSRLVFSAAKAEGALIGNMYH